MPEPGQGSSGSLRSLSAARVAWAIGLALVVAVLLNPIFAPPFVVVFGRTVFVALLLLLAFTVAGHWHQALLPRWLAQALAVGLMAPLATSLVYLMSTGGDVGAIVQNPGRVAGFLYIAGSALIVGLVLALGAQVREREAEARTLALQLELQRSQQARQALDARLAVMTAQVEPHFLFNTLANVQALVETGSPRAPEVLRSLIAYLRAALPRLHEDGGLPTLANELALVRAYLELMHLRMPDRLRWRLDVADGLDSRRVPAMALLTLVENAVRHGVDPAEDGGEIEVGARAEPGGGLRLWVADTGVGLSARRPPAVGPAAVPGAAPVPSAGTGLANLRARLQGVYGAAARVDLQPQAPHGVRAEIVLPAEETRR